MASESVKVVVRCRPLNQREKDLNCKVIAKIDSSCGHVGLTNPADQSGTSKSFTFDAAYFIDSSTEQIYNEICFPIVEALTEGYNGTVFAYGQTGCGKSFTMQGTSDPVHRGIIPRAFEHIFEAVSTSENYKFLVQASFLEIYNEEIRDLLGGDIKKKLELKESPDTGVSVGGLSKHIVHDVKSCERIMQEGWKNRSVGATLMNADSSRSHSIFTIYLERIGLDDLESNDIKYGKLNLVDLAGSERQAKTGATGDRLREATKINLSLSALGNVISALVDGKSTHIPYRDSKLTRLLQDSLGGNTKTLMVACISPADNNYDETLSTLRYANRAKNIQNKPKVNEDPKDAMLREYREEILRLKQLIEISGGSGGSNSTANTAGNGDTDSRDIEQMKRTYDTQMQDLARKYEEEVKHKEKLKEDMDRLKSLMENNDQPKSNSLKESMRKLQAIEKGMIGGEKAGDIELKERRARKKKVAETKMNAISEALSQLRAEDDDNLLLKAYGDITEELRAKAQLLKKAKRKIQSLEQEVLDLHSEFECERTDYLETIRRQEEQLRLMTQLFDTIAPLMRTECNFSSLDKIKANSYWDDNRRQWVLPQITWNHIKLPATGPNGYNGSPSPSQRYHPDSPTSVFDSDLIDHQGSGVTISQQRPDRLLMKLENSENEALATKYFLPKRKEQLLDNLHKFKMSVKSVENGGQHQPQQQQQQRAPMNGVAPESGFSLDARNMINTISTRLVDRSSRFNEHFKHSSVPPTHSSPNPLLQNIVTNLSIPHSSSQSAESPRNLLPLQRS